MSHYHGDIDADKMHVAAQALLGEQDFTSFRAIQCQSKTPFRNVHSVKVTRQGMYVIVDLLLTPSCTIWCVTLSAPAGNRSRQSASDLDGGFTGP